jgi:hypothetical protein
MVNSSNENLLGLYCKSTDQTDIIEIVKEENGFYRSDFIRTIPKKVSIILMHEDRLIVDNEVYIEGEVKQTLKVDAADITSAVVLDESNILVGTNRYASMCHFRWQGKKVLYKAKPRKIIKHYAPKCRPFDIKCL